jgi:hypothetical protein
VDSNFSLTDSEKADDEKNRRQRVDPSDNVWQYLGPSSEVDFGANPEEQRDYDGDGDRNDVDQPQGGLIPPLFVGREWLCVHREIISRGRSLGPTTRAIAIA